ncbi:MAG: hypothetical protein ACK40O_09110 [Allosphingosinicella sp.]
MADPAAPLRIARLRIRAPSADAARGIAAQFSGEAAALRGASAPTGARVRLEAQGDAPGRAAARALAGFLNGGRDG